VRGRTVLDRNGEEVGKVDDLLIDERQRSVHFLRVGAGGFLGIGASHVLVPVEAVAGIDADHVHIDRDRAALKGAPGYDPDLTYDLPYYGDVYGWWGYGSYWGPGYIYPSYPLYPR
jgi:sporulation protein YlmC with PRC-barrel domain